MASGDHSVITERDIIYLQMYMQCKSVSLVFLASVKPVSERSELILFILNTRNELASLAHSS